MADTQKIYLGDNLFNNMALGDDMVSSLYADITPATLFIDAAGITDTTQQLAIDNLYTDLYTNNLWDKFYRKTFGNKVDIYKFAYKTRFPLKFVF